MPRLPFASAAVLVLCLLMFAAVAAFTPQAHAAASPDARAVSAHGHWVVSGSCARYKVSGKSVKGLVAIKGKTYLFDSKGVQRTGWRRVNGIYYRFAPRSKAAAFATCGKVVNGVRLNKYGQALLSNKNVVAELETMVAAQKLLDKLSKPLQSKSTKLRACFRYIINPKKIRVRVLHPWSSQGSWWRRFANDIFYKRAGDCNSMGFAMAYLANAIGYGKCMCASSGGHSWARIDGRVYDPQQGNYAVGSYYGGVNYGRNETYKAWITRGKVWKGKKISGAGVSVKRGLVKSNGALYFYNSKGRMLTSKWKSVKGKRYYFAGTGKAVKGGSVKVRGAYYVFSAKGVLLTGKKTRIVKVSGTSYQVDKKGRAKSGWNKPKTMCFKKDGAMCAGIELVGGKLMAFSAAGKYSAAQSSALQKAARNTFNAPALIALMGTPQASFSEESCAGMTGPDGEVYGFDELTIHVYRYRNVSVQTASFKLHDGSATCEAIVDISAR